MRFLLAFSAILFSILQANAATYYFTIRTDNPQDLGPNGFGNGDGSVANPFDGRYVNGVSRFDGNMRRLTASFVGSSVPNEIHLAQGIYMTWGDNAAYPYGDKGFLLPPNTKLSGDGMKRTIVKLIDVDKSMGVGFRCVITSGFYIYDSNGQASGSGRDAKCDAVSVENLTVDCNSGKIWPFDEDFRGIGDFGITGIRLNGSNTKVFKAQVLHAYAVYGQGMESHGIVMNAQSDQASTNILVDSCVVEDPIGGYSNGITVFPGPNPVFRISGVVKNCVVKNNPWAAYNIGAGKEGVETLISGNTATDVGTGYFWDTASLFNVTLKYNTLITRDVDPSVTADLIKYHYPQTTLNGDVITATTPLNSPRAIWLNPYNVEQSTEPVKLGNLQILKNYFYTPGNSKGFIHFRENGDWKEQRLLAGLSVLENEKFKDIFIQGNTFASDNLSNQIFALDVDDGHPDDLDEMSNGRYTWEHGTEHDITSIIQNIQFLGGNLLLGSNSSMLWRPNPDSALSYTQTPSTTQRAAQLPDVKYSLPTSGSVPSVVISPSNSYTVQVGEPITFQVNTTSSDKLWSPNLPEGSTVTPTVPSESPSAPNNSLTSRAFSWIPSIDQVGDHTISFIAEYLENVKFGIISVKVLSNPAIKSLSWGSLTNAASENFPVGSSVEKAYPAVEGQLDSSAISSQQILADGSVSFRFSRSDKKSVMGLCVSSSTTATLPTYAIIGHVTGQVEIISANSSLGYFGGYSSANVFRISRESGLVKFYRDSTLLASSSSPLYMPLFAKALLPSFGGAVVDGIIKNGVLGEDLDWESPMPAQITASNVGSFVGGTTLTKTGGVNGNWDAEALSGKRISGNGFVSFRFGQTNQDISVSLNSAASTTTLRGEGKFEIRGAVNGLLQVIDNATPTSANVITSGTYTSSDVFRIERLNGTVKYYKNNALLATSSLVDYGPLRVECDLRTAGAIINNCVYGGGLFSKNVEWQYKTANVGPTTYAVGSQVQKTSGITDWDSEAVSTERIVNDGYVQFQFGSLNKTVSLALTARNRDSNPNNSEYAIILRPNVGGTPQVQIVEYLGAVYNTTLGFFPVALGDSFKIAREGGLVNFYKNGVLIASAIRTEAMPLMVECNFFEQGGLVKNCIYTGGLTVSSPSWDSANSTNVNFSTERGSRVDKITSAGSGAWNAWTWSEKVLDGDGYLQFQFGNKNGNLMTWASVMFTDGLGHNYEVKSQPNFKAQINDDPFAANMASYSPGDIFTISRSGATVNYYLNDHLLKAVPSTNNKLKVVCQLYDTDGYVTGINVSGSFVIP